jgi:hypothetical protein
MSKRLSLLKLYYRILRLNTWFLQRSAKLVLLLGYVIPMGLVKIRIV